MGLFSKDIKSMEDLLLHTLQDVYYAERSNRQIAAQDDRKIDQPRARLRLAQSFG